MQRRLYPWAGKIEGDRGSLADGSPSNSDSDEIERSGSGLPRTQSAIVRGVFTGAELYTDDMETEEAS